MQTSPVTLIPTKASTRQISVPSVVRRINNALLRADQIARRRDKMAGLARADRRRRKAGFGGPLNAFELHESMIAAGAAGVHWEDQLASGEEVRAPGRQSAHPDRTPHRTLNAARLAADISGVPSIIIARH
jgi:isocitrate lyase